MRHVHRWTGSVLSSCTDCGSLSQAPAHSHREEDWPASSQGHCNKIKVKSVNNVFFITVFTSSCYYVQMSTGAFYIIVGHCIATKVLIIKQLATRMIVVSVG